MTVKTQVSKVVQVNDLTPYKVRKLLWNYAKDDGLGIDDEKLEEFYERFKNKKYAMFIYLKQVESIRPFEIDKAGFGAMSAWVTIENIETIKR